MEYISFRVDKAVSRQIEKGMKEFHYNTKSDFLRDAIRIKLQQLEEDRKRKMAWDALYSAKGIFKGKVPAQTKEEEQEFEKKIDKEIMAHYGKKFGINLK
jgi:Arc/MetJ-type ribon-helix-helix transcriptional regulator